MKANAIVVGTDLTEESVALLAEAERMARAFEGHVVLVHAVQPIEDPDQADADTQAFHEKLMNQAEEWMERQRQAWDREVDLCTCVQLGPRVQVLLHEVKGRQARLLVLGSPFRGSGPPVGIGLQVLAQCPCPVLIVP
ncbi:MAG: universal stress protein [Vulcanimicrobiota bacterium]